MVKGIVPNEKVDQQNNIIKDIHQDSLIQEFYVEKQLPQKFLPIEGVLRKIQAQVTLKRIRIR